MLNHIFIGVALCLSVMAMVVTGLFIILEREEFDELGAKVRGGDISCIEEYNQSRITLRRLYMTFIVSLFIAAFILIHVITSVM